MYTIKAIDDPRTLNKTLYIRPPKNILSQREVVQVWEKLIGKELMKSSISKDDFLASLKGMRIYLFFTIIYIYYKNSNLIYDLFIYLIKYFFYNSLNFFFV